MIKNSDFVEIDENAEYFPCGFAEVLEVKGDMAYIYVIPLDPNSVTCNRKINIPITSLKKCSELPEKYKHHTNPVPVCTHWGHRLPS